MSRRAKVVRWLKSSPGRRKFLIALQTPRNAIARVRDFFVWIFIRGLIALLRGLGPERSSNLAGNIARRIGPWVPTTKVARRNIALAFPEKSPDEIESVVRGVWENLGRVAGEFVHLEKMWDFDPAHPTNGRIVFEPGTAEIYNRLRDDGKPAIVFSAHLANWELPAIAAAAHGLEAAVVYKAPTNPGFAELVRETRTGAMAELINSGKQSVFTMAKVLEEGRHLGILVDQHFTGGVEVTMFGRKARATPLAARLARNFDCPVHGVRAIRLPGNRFKMDLTEEIALPRDAEGKVDIAAATQTITSVIEGWVREHPDQWLWLHRRWR
jgi:KDO2-lipid IV(A) lauroyltransferase